MTEQLATTTATAMQAPPPETPNNIPFAELNPTERAFVLLKRRATEFSKANTIPAQFHGNVSNVMMALQYSDRLGLDPFVVMNEINFVHNRPSFSAKFIVGRVIDSKLFSRFEYRMSGPPIDGSEKELHPSTGCRVVATDLATGKELVGPLVTIKMAKGEGWSTKNGSKWVTMPELMLHYRAAVFWARVHCPDIVLGMPATEEVIDVHGQEVTPRGYSSPIVTTDTKELQAALLADDDAEVTPAENVDPTTGEVTP